MAPLRLYQRQARIGCAILEVEVGNSAQQVIDGWYEVSIKDDKKFAVGLQTPFLQGAGLVPPAPVTFSDKAVRGTRWCDCRDTACRVRW